MDSDITTLGEKGQVVIPQRLRKRLGMEPQTKFMVFGQGDVIVLKRLHLEDARKQWEAIFAKFKGKGITESDIEEAIQESRRERRKAA